MADVEVRINGAELAKLLNDPNGPVGKHLRKLGKKGTGIAKRLAPVSPDGSEGRRPGYLRSRIDWHQGADADGQYVDIGCDARNKAGHNYALDVELGTKPHVIRSHGDYPLRNPKTGQVFGREVHHPGTRAQPFLRPVLGLLDAEPD